MSANKTSGLLFVGILSFYLLLFPFFRGSLSIPTDTETFYSPMAATILSGEGYTVNGRFTDRYPPLFPAFLALVYFLTGHVGTGNPVYPYVVMALQSLSCVLLYRIALLFFDKTVAFASALLLATYPFYAVLSVTRYAWNAMPLFTAFCYGSLFLLLSGKAVGRHAVSGFVLALSTLIWPAARFLWVLFAAQGRAWKLAAAGLAGFFLPVLIWQVAVHWNIPPEQRSNALAVSMNDGVVRKHSSVYAHFDVVQDARAEDQRGGLKTTRDFFLFYKTELLQKPGELTRFFAFKLFRPWYATDEEKHDKLVAVVQVPYLLLGLFGIVQNIRDKKVKAGFLMAVILYFWFVACVVLSILRYMIPAMGLVLIFAASAGVSIFRGLARRHTHA